MVFLLVTFALDAIYYLAGTVRGTVRNVTIIFITALMRLDNAGTYICFFRLDNIGIYICYFQLGNAGTYIYVKS